MAQGIDKKAKLPFSLYFANGELIIPGGSLKLEHHPYYIFHHCPNQKHPLFYIDKNRLRGRRLNENKYEKLILVIGSSSAFGFQCGDERCWSALLEKIWFRETGYHVRVINAAVVGFITSQMFHQLLDLLQIYKPDYILAMGGWSEWFNIVYHPRTSDLFSFHSTFYHIESLCSKTPEQEADTKLEEETLTEIAKYFISEIQKLHTLACSYNAKLFYIFQPMITPNDISSRHDEELVNHILHNIPDYFEHLSRILALYHEHLEPLHIRNGGFVLPVEPKDIEIQGIKFIDYIHFSELAHHWLAKQLFNTLFKHTSAAELPVQEKIELTSPVWQKLEINPYLSSILKIQLPGWTDAQIKLVAPDDRTAIFCLRSSNRAESSVDVEFKLISSVPKSSSTEIRIADPLIEKTAFPFRLVSVQESNKKVKILSYLDADDSKHFDDECWLPPETFGPDGKRFRWVLNGRAWLEWKPPEKADYFKIVARPLSDQECTWMHVSIDNIEVASIPMESEWIEYWIQIPDWLPSINGRILLTFQPLWSPADLHIAPDPRILSAAVHSLQWVMLAG